MRHLQQAAWNHLQECHVLCAVMQCSAMWTTQLYSVTSQIKILKDTFRNGLKIEKHESIVFAFYSDLEQFFGSE